MLKYCLKPFRIITSDSVLPMLEVSNMIIIHVIIVNTLEKMHINIFSVGSIQITIYSYREMLTIS